MDGKELHNAAEYLRGRIQAVPDDSSVAIDRRVREAHLNFYRRTRRNALALWVEKSAAGSSPHSDSSTPATDGWPEDDEGRLPCLLWCSGHWHCASAGWCDLQKKMLKVSFIGYDDEDAVFVDPEDPRIRRAVLDPRRGRDHPNAQVLKGIFPKTGDHVRVHVVDAAEASVFLQEGVYLTGVVSCPLATHDSSLVSVIGLGGEEAFLVPNARMEHVTAEEFARVVDTLKVARNQVLRQLDIATSQTIAIEVVSGVGEVADDSTPISLWALGDQMLIRVWQQKGEFMLSTSVSASEALAAVRMEDSGLNVLSEGERRQLLDGVRDRIRVSQGCIQMEMEKTSSLRRDRHTSTDSTAEIHREMHVLEDVPVETVVRHEGRDGLRVRSTTLPPGPELSHDMIAQAEDWAFLGYPSLPWLDRTRMTSLARQLTRCVSARDGGLVLQIGSHRMLRPEGFFPVPPFPQANSSKPSRFPETNTRNRRPNECHAHGGVSSCTSGAPSGLCSCRILLRTGVSLPLSITDDEPAAGNRHGNNDSLHVAADNNDNNNVNDINNNNNNDDDNNDNSGGSSSNNKLSASSRSRWLVLVTATGGELALSLLRPARGLNVQAPGTGSEGDGARSGSGTRRIPHAPKRLMRRCRTLATTWADWAQLGYGPLQWMSHAQKAIVARLSLHWVVLKTPAVDTGHRLESLACGTEQAFDLPEEAFLCFRPVLSSATRIVGTPSDTKASAMRRAGAGGPGGGIPTQAVRGIEKEGSSRAARVRVRDEGGVLRVEVELGRGGVRQLRVEGAQRLEQTFGKEAWQETGLGELLWLDCSARQYLAHRLCQQVAVVAAEDDEGGSEERKNNITGGVNEQAKLTIVSDLPLPYWNGTAAIARLGSHAAGVFVSITDAGRRFFIEARDFEAGPLLATSTVPFEAWTAMTGMATLKPPADSSGFRATLEDQLATLLGTGFRSRTSRLEKKRAAREVQQEEGQKERNGGSKQWRGTFLELSEMEKGAMHLEEDDDGWGEPGASRTSCSKEPRKQQKQPSLLPRVSRSELTPLEQKRALRLEMLSRMIDEFHDKHGRRTGGKTRKKNAGDPAPTKPDPAVVSCRTSNGNNKTDKSTSDPGREPPAAAGERREPDGGKTGTSLPAIGPSPPPAVPKGGNNGTQDVVLSAEVNPARTAESGSSVGGDEESSAVSLAQAASPRSCVCCGGEGGRGHGRRCEHTFRRCGFCRVEEVRRVLGIRDKRRRESGDTRAQEKARVPTLPLAASDVGNDDEELEWVTDSDEENPEFECDSCGRLIEDTADRFHCETCGDYDLCQACFLSHKTSSGYQGKQEDGAGESRHLATHDVTRIMGKPAVSGP